MSRTTTQLPTFDGKSITAVTVDRRAEYQAKVLNRGLHHAPGYRWRKLQGLRLQLAILAAHHARQQHRTATRLSAQLAALNWQPCLPRIDAPPPARKRA
jgi:hypothetical protein